MKKNDSIELKIEDMGVDGEGIGKYEGMTFFVKDAVIGDTIRAGITKLKKNYGYARVQEILEPSPYRVQPECPLYARCGGCQIQAMDYGQQLCYKQKKVRGNLIRIGGFAPELIDSVMEEIVGMEQPYRYRNKAQFPIGVNKDGQPVAGFYAARTHNIIPVEDCKLGVTQNEQILGVVLSYMRENGVRPYDETTGRGLVRHVLIRYGFTSKELMVCLVINGETLPQEKKLVDVLCKMDGMTSISVNINRKNTNVILGEETRTIWGSDYITDQIHLRDCDHDFVLTDTAIAYHISPQSFYQVNPVQTQKLYEKALEYAGLEGNETVWDLYCGIGTISLFLSQRAKTVYGVEIVPQAIDDAKNNAKINGITNAEFFVGKAEEVLPEFYADAKKNITKGSEAIKPEVPAAKYTDEADMLTPDVIVVDPPRKGCDSVLLDTITAMHPDRIVYVSCDSATLARDLKYLTEKVCSEGKEGEYRYQVEKVQPVDMFPWSAHVETVVLLSKLQQK